jgi:hypothetical protein
MLCAAPLLHLISGLLPMLPHQRIALRHQGGDGGIGGQRRYLLLPQIEILGGQALQIGFVGHRLIIVQDREDWPAREDYRCGKG